MHRRGEWALDVAYALSIGLRTDDRRAWEKDLIKVYLKELAAAGGEPPTLDEALLAYRQQMFHAVAFWLGTIGIGEDSPVAPEICRLNLQRTTQAVVDLDSFGAVGVLMATNEVRSDPGMLRICLWAAPVGLGVHLRRHARLRVAAACHSRGQLHRDRAVLP